MILSIGFLPAGGEIRQGRSNGSLVEQDRTKVRVDGSRAQLGIFGMLMKHSCKPIIQHLLTSYCRVDGGYASRFRRDSDVVCARGENGVYCRLPRSRCRVSDGCGLCPSHSGKSLERS